MIKSLGVCTFFGSVSKKPPGLGLETTPVGLDELFVEWQPALGTTTAQQINNRLRPR